MTSRNLYIMIIYHIVMKEESNNRHGNIQNLSYRTTLLYTPLTLVFPYRNVSYTTSFVVLG